jgi:hypothetical protein
LAAIPTMPPKGWMDDGGTVLGWETARQQMAAFGSGRDLWRNLDPGARLDWVLRFIQTDLDKITEQERANLGYVLKAILPKPVHAGAAVYHSSGVLEPAPMSEPSLKKIQRLIAGAIKGLAGTEGYTIRFPGPVEISFSRFNAPITVRESGAEIPGKLQLQYTWDWGGNDVGRILYGVADLLLDPAAKNLRLCLWEKCRKPFIAESGSKRKICCSPECGQKRRDKKKAEKAKEQAKPSTKRRATP